ncbi:MAG: GNAT family N-acetyltransferase [Helicobacteraceae bacterium]|jgi:N-acyl-L-homoserine lactone synthetase|nr:GNAT family N-acetyltransferase [Helicobacteraceae bacterium]
MSYQFVEVTSEDQLEKVYAFRYDIVCEKLGVTELEGCEPNRETDEYDAYSEHYAAFDENGEVIACTRLIHHSPIGYPTTNNMDYDRDNWHFDPEKLAEFSRIFVSPKIRSIKELQPLFNTMKSLVYPKVQELEISYILGALEKPFLRLLNILQLPYKPIGDLQSYITPRFPCIMYTNETIEVNPEIYGKSET